MIQRTTLAAALSLATFFFGCRSDPHFDDPIEGPARPAVEVNTTETHRREAGEALGVDADKTILFGDLHVHTSYSFDGYLFSLPVVGGEGAHPPNDACDFARYCADLDFYALTDHAESLVERTWEASKESVRQCNDVAGDPSDPDVVAFMGFEWSQAGTTPDTHWGHRCVFFRDTADDDLPTRPIGSNPGTDTLAAMRDNIGIMRWATPWNWQIYSDYMSFVTELVDQPLCAEGVPMRDLPPDCKDVAETPEILREKLDDWGHDAFVIPHGTAWGTYTPATATIDKHLDPAQFDPERQLLVEIMSGHGNSEEFRSWHEWAYDDAGNPVCPRPTEDYLPCCWQAGEIMRSRCGDLPKDECRRRIAEARRLATQAFTRPQQIFPDASPEDWLDCGQCRDCFKPSFEYRPRESIQYAMTLTREDATGPDGKPLRFRYGFVGSSDNHTARPGTGYKPLESSMMTDIVGEPNFIAGQAQAWGTRMEDPQRPNEPVRGRISLTGNDMRVGSFLYPGGLAAVHSTGRSREEIWDAMQRREVYGTSGQHMLLWFDLVDEDGARHPMGSQVERNTMPRFEVRAAGAPLQEPGCPGWVHRGLSPDRVERLCRGECHNPGDERHPIEAIEVVRIRTREYTDEPPELLIEDPWERFECDGDPSGCVVQFEDPEFSAEGRDTLYYVRAVQQETLEINGGQLRTRFDERGRARSTDPCAPGDGDCLAPSAERAWSSPIFVDFAPVSKPTGRVHPGGPS